MARTDEGAVREVLTRDYDSRNLPSLLPFIKTANVVTTRVNTCAVAKGVTLTTDELELIERWLAAHFYKYAWDRQFSNKSELGASAGFGGQTAMALDGTTYGQTAKVVDASGCLAAISMAARAGADWLGKVPSEQVPYDQRD